MIADALQALTRLAQDAVKPEQPQPFDLLNSADGRRVAYVYGGKLTSHDLDPDPDNVTVYTPQDLVGYLDDSEGSPDAVVTIGEDYVHAFRDDTRRNQARLPLPRSAVFAALEALAGGKSFGQRDAINFLRRTLAGTGFESYAQHLRDVVFERNATGTGNLQRNQESMGKAINAAVAGIGDLPETLTGTIPIFEPVKFWFTSKVQLGVDPRLDQETFEFWLPPNVLDQAVTLALLELREYLTEKLPEAVILLGKQQ